MTFAEAREKLRAGEYVRRRPWTRSWARACVIAVADEGGGRLKTWMKLDGDTWPLSLSADDLAADDWEVLP